MYSEWQKKSLENGISKNSLLQKDLLYNQLLNDIDQKNKKLLLVGSVQSGKTATYIGLICKLFETTKTNLVILFCGVSNVLKSQTLDRFEDNFKGFTNVSIRTSERGNYNYDDVLNDLMQNKKVILISIKHHTHIKNIARWFNNSQYFISNPLIIDDEGDQASFYNLDKYSRDGEHSTTYTSFLGFFQNENCCTFMSITATPYAHIIAHKEWFGLEPDYVYLIPEGEDYLSFSSLYSHREIFKTLTEKDVAELDIQKDEMGLWHLINMPFSAKAAIINYYISHKKYQSDVKKCPYQSEMIINVDRRIAVHFSIRDKINEFITDFEYKPLFRKEIINYLYPNASEDEKQKYESFALDIIDSQECELRIIDCANEEEKGREIEPLNFYKQCNIIIGGLTIGRGVSFPTLLSFYYINDKPKKYTIDNIIQVCRFLGYRNKVVPYYSIWLSKRVQEIFETIFDADDRIRERISYYQNNHKDFHEFARGIQINIKSNADYVLFATRQTIAKQYITPSIQTLYNDSSFDFKSDDDELINNGMTEIFYLLLSKHLSIRDKHYSSELGECFGNYPILYFDNFTQLVEELDHSINNSAEEILKSYFKLAINSKDVIDYAKASNKKIIVSLMIYELDEQTGKFTKRNVLYHKDRKEYSYYRQGYRADYIGDNNWAYEYKRQSNEEAIFIQLFVLSTPNEYRCIFDKDVIKMQIILPTENLINESMIVASDEDDKKIKEDAWFK